ncbi:MAG: hypothetical protein OER80_00885 [Gammaproteobacteria bacterium]|nr:hypothetical protein [Gammaproteobacteria bacterium]MDH3768752.1 hypothetical protein [Gammaproteobacteria bacterium]
MSSARILLAAVAFGLAACAHTPPADTFYMPDIRNTAPVRIVDAVAPNGFDDHVVILLDPEGIERIVRAEGQASLDQLYFFNASYPSRQRRSAPVVVSRPRPGSSQPTIAPATRVESSSDSRSPNAATHRRTHR